MPLVKTILKNTKRETFVKFVGNGTDALTLASLIATGQTVTGTPFVSITSMSVNTGSTGVCTITRNVVVALHTVGSANINGSSPFPFTVSENGSFDINVNLTTDGMLILRLSKENGYSE